MDEKMLILKMLESGKINAEEAYKLLNAVENNENPKSKNKNQEKSSYHAKKTYLSITLEKKNGEKSNVRIPISIAKLGLNAGSKFSSELQGLNIVEIINSLEQSRDSFVTSNDNKETITFKLV